MSRRARSGTGPGSGTGPPSSAHASSGSGKRSRMEPALMDDDSPSPTRRVTWHSPSAAGGAGAGAGGAALPPHHEALRPPAHADPAPDHLPYDHGHGLEHATTPHRNITGFLRHWKERQQSGTDAAQRVVHDLLLHYGQQGSHHHARGQDMAPHQQRDQLSTHEAQALQSFVSLLQSFSHQHSVHSTPVAQKTTTSATNSAALPPQTPPPPPPALYITPSSSPPPPPPPPPHAPSAGLVEELPANPSTQAFVSMVAREMEEIMSLHDAGLLDFDDCSVPAPRGAPPQTPLSMRQALIDSEVAAVSALMEAGWWDVSPSSLVHAAASVPAPLAPSPIQTKDLHRFHSGDAPGAPSSLPAFQYSRLRVLETWSTTYSEDRQTLPQLVLRCILVPQEVIRFVALRREWIVPGQTPESGDILHLVGSFDAHDTAIVDREQNYVIVNPDRLIRVTSIGNSCERRSVLEEKLKLPSDAAELVYGTVMHAVFEFCLMRNDWSDVCVSEALEIELKKHMERLYGLDESISAVKERVAQAMPRLREWAERFLSSSSSSSSNRSSSTSHKKRVACFDSPLGTTPIRVRRVLAVEQSIWSPCWGLTGKVDVVVEASLGGTDDAKCCVVPFELKTGLTSQRGDTNGSPVHRGQVMLYTLLLQDHYRVPVDWGLLFYTHNLLLLGVTAHRNLIMGLLMQRNALAYYLTHPLLPPLKRDSLFCGRCAQLHVCMLNHKARENGTIESAGVGSLFAEKTDHLRPIDLQWYRKWDDITRLEWATSDEFKSELWSFSSVEREKAGGCLANMRIIQGEGGITASRSHPHCDVITLSKQEPINLLSSLLDSSFSVGDHVVLSTEDGRFGVLTGFVVSLSSEVISIDLRSALALPPMIMQATSAAPRFHAIVDIEDASVSVKSLLLAQKKFARSIVWRIDKDLSSGSSVPIFNKSLATLMAPQHASLRELLIAKRAPRVASVASVERASSSKLPDSLNTGQRRAIECALSTQDYSLILGTPGAGKTTVVAWLVKELYDRKQSVLITGFTHASVDTLLLKLIELGVPFLRLAPSRTAVHSDVQPFVAHASDYNSMEELQRRFEEPLIVGATCLGVRHALFQRRATFDVCVVDEASQITLPAVVGPLLCARRFVLVGDHYQLPPLVQNADARDGGLGESLFFSLSQAHPQAVTMLEVQYRMNQDIVSVCNRLVYSNRLCCGNQEVARSQLEIPHGVGSIREGWLREVCRPERRVVLVDTDGARLGEDIAKREHVHNPGEAQVVVLLVRELVAVGGLEQSSIGVITPFRAQVQLIQQQLEEAHLGRVECNTVDRCQGRDWDCVILSLVRSNDARLTGDLLMDWRRLNVALTRAKKKLVLVGDPETLDEVPSLGDLFQMCRENQWIVPLPRQYK